MEVCTMAERGLIPMVEAARRLGVSKLTMRRLVQEHGLQLYANHLDKREKLLDAGAVENLRRPTPLPVGDGQGKAAA
jgi:hypothetical protein